MSDEHRATLRYRERAFDTPAIKILPGEFYVTSEEIALTTTLGSCVAACIHDPVACIGGMNHFMLPDSSGERNTSVVSSSARYGTFAMELLLNQLYAAGASRRRLQARVFGGAHVLPGASVSHVGKRNAEFVRDFLRRETIELVGHKLAGTDALKVCFFPATGKTWVKPLPVSDVGSVARLEVEHARRIRRQPTGGDVELF
ncbi:MAG: chemoreceptor glutamine deamidase CheD [Rhodocyclaceae bacterium]|nr:chemoreceptor glutamine deamidase CheD [Rhodocyclaceae bacterium]